MGDQKQNQENNLDRIRPYGVDGIHEYDNPMPKWWLWLFYFCIAFAFVYMIQLHILDGESINEEYLRHVAENKAQQEAFEKEQLALEKKSGGVNFQDANLIASGSEVYSANCAPCHGANGEGVVGPNLTDKYWKNGGHIDDIVKVITVGVPEKGMVPWKDVLGKAKINAVSAYVASLQGKTPDNPKAPEGELFEGDMFAK